MYPVALLRLRASISHSVLLTVAGGALVAAFVLVVFPNLQEDVMFAIQPSAERAYLYGETHFNAKETGLYDVERAEYFFKKAEKLNSKLPYVHHELARIAFLHGMYQTAMKHINIQIEQQGDAAPNSYYIRGLIEGYMGDYESAAKDYQHYLKFDPHNWAALNDYAWVLLKAERFAEAVNVTQKGLSLSPENAWLLNSSATALYELGRYDEALVQAKKAQESVQSLTELQWLTSYPGNDPKVAASGIESFKKAIDDNVNSIVLRIASSSVQK